MIFKGFWDNLDKPIIGLAPMDGVTDAPFRLLTAKYGKPSVQITEFTNVEGLARGAIKMLEAFLYDETERPIVAQIYGVEAGSFYKAAVMLSAMGFDGIDINMGCPATKVAQSGAGAGLIRTPDLAKELISITKKGVTDWANGISLQDAGVHPAMIEEIYKTHGTDPIRRQIPVSVKTRIGYDSVIAEEWINHLLETQPANITLHGRTLRQMYLGNADWEVIGKACRVVKQSGLTTGFLGNGDVSSMEDALKKISDYGVDGVLVGRATFGNPWFFSSKIPDTREQLTVAIEHSHLFEKIFPHVPFVIMRKHLGWYCKGFDGAKELRVSLMNVSSANEVEEIIKSSTYL